jgi:hypothetical protein
MVAGAAVVLSTVMPMQKVALADLELAVEDPQESAHQKAINMAMTD